MQLLQRAIVGIVGGALVGAVVGFVVGASAVGVIWTLLGVAEQLPLGELAQVLPWSIIMGLITAVLGALLGTILGIVLPAVAPYVRLPRWGALLGALLGLVGGGGAALLIWDLAINGTIALVTTLVLAVTGALIGPLILRGHQRWGIASAQR
jgi:hypothetical protein